MELGNLSHGQADVYLSHLEFETPGVSWSAQLDCLVESCKPVLGRLATCSSLWVQSAHIGSKVRVCNRLANSF